MLRCFGKTFGNEIVLTASVPQKPGAMSAVSMSIDHRALENGSVGYNEDIPAYRIHNPTSTNKSSDVSCCEKNNTLSSMVDSTKKSSEVSCCKKNNTSSSMVDDIDKGSKSSDDLDNVYDGIHSLEPTRSDNVGDDHSVNQDDTLKTQTAKQSRTEKQLLVGAFASKIVGNTKGLEKAFSLCVA